MEGNADADPPQGAAVWRNTLTDALRQRQRWTELPLRELASNHPASMADIADIAIGLHKRGRATVNPLVPRYIDQLLRTRCTDATHVLFALLRASRLASPSTAPEYNTGIEETSAPFEDQIFTLLRKLLAELRLDARHPKTMLLVKVLRRWLYSARKANEEDVRKKFESGIMSGVGSPATSTYESLGLLAFAVLGHQSFPEVDTLPFWKPHRAEIVSEIEQFDAQVLHWIQSRYAGQLQTLMSSRRPFLPTDENGLPILTDEQVLANINITDVQVTTSRAGLFVWLNACLCARPLTDDATMRNYMMVRSGENAQSAAVDLLIASFDVLTNALLRHESTQSVRLITSFICNKAPLLLNSLLGFNGSGAVENCVQMSFMAITMDPLTPLSTGATGVRDVLKKTRLEFLLACALHSLVTERVISALVNEPSVAIPKTTRYTKEGLLAQTSNNTGRLDTIIQELDTTNGNAGAIAGCVVDTVNNLCASRDTAELKAVCTSLTKKFPNLDVIMLFTQPATLLHPLCTILNDWVHDQESSEFQPPYEEFACILLFVLAACHRYDLQAADLGLMQDDSFIMKMLHRVPQNLQVSDLSKEQSEQFSKWVEGLYATDEHGETTGIGDDVMSQCPPQAFYLLVPLLFDQTVLACRSDALSIDTMRGGLEFLLEPFLLPSLVGGISWLVKHSWEDHNDADILLPILEKLLKPSGSSQDMQAMHRCILGIVSIPLESSLQTLIRRKPEKRDQANALIEIVKPHLHQQRTMVVTKAELDEFATEGLYTQAVRNSIRSLAGWAASGSSDAPPRYASHLVHCAIKAHNSFNVLNAVVEEFQEQTDLGNGSIALDVCAALVCAPEPASYTTLMNIGGTAPQISGRSLHDAIHVKMMEVQKLLKMPPNYARALVRLFRRVEAQSAVSQVAMVNLQPSADEQVMSEQVMQDLGLGTNDVPMAVGDSLLTDNGGLDQNGNTDFGNTDFNATANGAMDLSGAGNQELNDMMQLDSSNDIFGSMNVDFSQPVPGQAGQSGIADNGEQNNAEDDIFAGLDMGDMGDMGDFDFS